MKDEVKKGFSIVGKIIKWIIIAVLIIVVAVIGYSIYTCTAVTKAVVDTPLVKDAVKEAAGGQDAAKMASEAIEITPEALYDAYDSNEVKADTNYKDKSIRLTGKVGDIGKDLLDKPYITFKIDEYGMKNVQLYFKTSEQSKINELDKGQTVTIVGTCDGKKVINVVIKDAFFE